MPSSILLPKFGSAFLQAATMETVVNGFNQTIICPIGRDVFPQHLFAPSERPTDPNSTSKLTVQSPVPVTTPVIAYDACDEPIFSDYN